MKAIKFKHLRLEDRIAIETYLGYGITISKIALRIGKDRTTIAKEVKRWRYRAGQGDGDCEKLSKSPFVCNGCKDRPCCRLRKMVYTGSVADNECNKCLRSSRAHLRITKDDIQKINEVVAPLMIERHHSVNQVYINHPERLPFCKSTFYRYIDCGILAVRNIDLARKVRYKVKKEYDYSREVRNPRIRVGRFYSDFVDFIGSNPDTEVVEMDTVIGTSGGKGGKCLLTIFWRKPNLMKVILLPYKRSKYVTQAFICLREALGNDFKSAFPAILTDNGTEFDDPESIEFSHLTGEKETSVFYCDPNSSWQKGGIERNHELIRYILPKGTSFSGLTQKDCDLIADNINSVPRVSLNGHTPYEAELMYLGKEKMDKLGFKAIARDEVNLSIKLIK